MKEINKEINYDKNIYLLSRIYRENIKPNKRKFLALCLVATLFGLSNIINLAVFQKLFDEVVIGKKSSYFYVLSGVFCANILWMGYLLNYQISKSKLIAKRFMLRTNLKLYEHYIYSCDFILGNKEAVKLLSRHSKEISKIGSFFSKYLNKFMTIFGIILSILVTMFFINKHTLLLFVISFISLRYPSYKLNSKIKKSNTKSDTDYRSFTQNLEQNLENLVTIKSYCREEHEIQRAGKLIINYLDRYKKYFFDEVIIPTFASALKHLPFLITSFYATYILIKNIISPGELIVILIGLTILYLNIFKLTSIQKFYTSGLKSFSEIYKILDSKSKHKNTSNKKISSLNGYHIQFKNVYLDEGNTAILEDLSIVIPQGKNIAFAGYSTTEKSSIISLLLGLNKPSSGEIFIGGQNIKSLDVKSIRNNIALVPKDVKLLKDTIKENIRYGKLDATEEEIIDAALASASHDFITEMPKSYSTVIDNEKLTLTKSQIQRIAIARAILKNSPILILDEATSELDAISEKHVNMSLDYLAKDRTTILITNKANTLEKADFVYFIDQGKIKDFGKHKDLLTKNATYRQMINNANSVNSEPTN